MDHPALDRLAAECAPRVHPATAAAIVARESGGNAWAVGINGRRWRLSAPPRSAAAAETVARELIRRGVSVDLGLAQINSANLRRLGLSVADAFDPCKNLAAMQRLMVENFRRAGPAGRQDQRALAVALSYYNTGRPDAGLRNGYVRGVYAAARRISGAGRTD